MIRILNYATVATNSKRMKHTLYQPTHSELPLHLHREVSTTIVCFVANNKTES
jgi:hypothetical protein